MNASLLSHTVDPLREMLHQFDGYIAAFRERSGCRVAGVTCDFIPVELIASRGLVPLRVPSFIEGCCTCQGIAGMGRVEGVYDCIVAPRGCAGRSAVPRLAVPLREFHCPAGWGGDAVPAMERAIENLLAAEGMPGPARPDPERLRAVTEQYNALRRIVRRICAARREKPELLSHRDLAVLFDAALALPPDTVMTPLAAVLEALLAGVADRSEGIPAVVYSSFSDGSAADAIEDAGCLVVEDDQCGGRRQFDQSYNHESDRLAEEILEAASFRPLCPSVRPVNERVELYYAMMKGQGIELVVFIEDECCAARKRDIAELRVRLMRSGIDPLVVTRAGAGAAVTEYVRRSGPR